MPRGNHPWNVHQRLVASGRFSRRLVYWFPAVRAGLRVPIHGSRIHEHVSRNINHGGVRFGDRSRDGRDGLGRFSI